MRAFVIRSSDIDRCPIRSFNPNHYRDDGSCLHVPPVDAPARSAQAARTVKALSLYQPWASLVAEGVKTVETRPWSTSYRGPLAIASTKRGPAGMISIPGVQWRYVIDYEDQRRNRSWLDANGIELPLPLPAGCVVATCTLVECVRTERIQWEPERFEVKGRLVEWTRGGMAADRFDARIAEEQRPFGDYSPGRWAWLLADVVKIDPPVPVKGRQGLWKWDPSAQVGCGRTPLPNAILGG